jgi:hypothetical protein
MKNRLINGDMRIDQRNAGASVATSSGTAVFFTDRWSGLYSQTSKFTAQQNAGSVTPPVGFVNYLGITSTSPYSVGASEQFNLIQVIEGFNSADLGWGTANAKTVTLSFQVYSSLTGTFGGCLQNTGKARAYPFTYSIPVANTWTPISVTIAGDTTGTWNTTNGVGIYVNFGLGVGSTVSATAGAWTGAGNIFGATGATSVVGTNGATFYITGVQLEVGSSATGFEYRQYQQELALCQRYYEYGGLNSFVVSTAIVTAAPSRGFAVTKRASPTVTLTINSGTGATTLVDVNGFYQNTANSALANASWTASSEL